MSDESESCNTVDDLIRVLSQFDPHLQVRIHDPAAPIFIGKVKQPKARLRTYATFNFVEIA